MNKCMGCMADLAREETTCPHCGYVQGTEPEKPFFLPPGTILKGRYILGKTMGYGGFGITYIGYDQQEREKVAVKEFFPGDYVSREKGSSQVEYTSEKAKGSIEELLQDFLTEARALAKLGETVPGLVKTIDIVEENGTGYVVMEYLTGYTVRDYLQTGQALYYDSVKRVILMVLDTLSQVHTQGIIHRYINPDNIFVTNDGDVKILDFGSVRYAAALHSKRLTDIVVPGYSPVELYNHYGEIGAAVDIYEVAAVFYRMVTGIEPQESVNRLLGDEIQTPTELGIPIPKADELALMKALGVRSKERFRTCDGFARALTGQGRRRKTGDESLSMRVDTPLGDPTSVYVGSPGADSAAALRSAREAQEALQKAPVPEESVPEEPVDTKKKRRSRKEKKRKEEPVVEQQEEQEEPDDPYTRARRRKPTPEELEAEAEGEEGEGDGKKKKKKKGGLLLPTLLIILALVGLGYLGRDFLIREIWNIIPMANDDQETREQEERLMGLNTGNTSVYRDEPEVTTQAQEEPAVEPVSEGAPTPEDAQESLAENTTQLSVESEPIEGLIPQSAPVDLQEEVVENDEIPVEVETEGGREDTAPAGDAPVGGSNEGSASSNAFQRHFEESRTYTCLLDSIVIYASPNIRSERIASYAAGDEMVLVGEARGEDDTVWYMVSTSAGEGFIRKDKRAFWGASEELESPAQ